MAYHPAAEPTAAQPVKRASHPHPCPTSRPIQSLMLAPPPPSHLAGLGHHRPVPSILDAEARIGGPFRWEITCHFKITRQEPCARLHGALAGPHAPDQTDASRSHLPSRWNCPPAAPAHRAPAARHIRACRGSIAPRRRCRARPWSRCLGHGSAQPNSLARDHARPPISSKIVLLNPAAACGAKTPRRPCGQVDPGWCRSQPREADAIASLSRFALPTFGPQYCTYSVAAG